MDWRPYNYAIAIGLFLMAVGGLTTLHQMTSSEGAKRSQAIDVQQEVIASLKRVDKPDVEIPDGALVYLEGVLSNGSADSELLDVELGVKLQPSNNRMPGVPPRPEPKTVLRSVLYYNGQRWTRRGKQDVRLLDFPVYIQGVKLPWIDPFSQYNRGKVESVELASDCPFLSEHSEWSRSLEQTKFGNYGQDVVFRQAEGQRTKGDFRVFYSYGPEEQSFGALGQVKNGELVRYQAPPPFDTLRDRPVTVLAMVNLVPAPMLKGLEPMGATFDPVATLESLMKVPVERGEAERKVSFHVGYSIALLLTILGLFMLGRGLTQRRKFLTEDEAPSL